MDLQEFKEMGRMHGLIHLQAYNELYGEGNVKVLLEYGDFDSEENKEKEHKIEAEGFRFIEENMFGTFGEDRLTGKIVIFLKNGIEEKPDSEANN